jgi:hypothetical protein
VSKELQPFSITLKISYNPDNALTGMVAWEVSAMWEVYFLYLKYPEYTASA